MEAVVLSVLAVGVKVAVYTLLLVEDTAKPDKLPPVTVTSAALKPETASEKVKVTVAVSPSLRLVCF